MSDTRTHLRSEGPRDPFLAALGLDDLLEVTPNLAFVCDAEGNLLWASRTFGSLTGLPESGLLGRPLLPHLTPVARQRVLRAVAEQRSHETAEFEITVPVVDAQSREAEVTAHVLRRERPGGGLIFAGTLSEVRTATPDGASGGPHGARAGSLQVSEVLPALNQEIRAPMNAMIGMARLLLQTKLDEEQLALVEDIWKSGQSTLRLVNDAYEFTCVEQGQLDLDLIAFDLRVTLDETVAALTALAAEKGLALECRVHPAVPSRLRGDPSRLRQVLLDLGEKAIKTLARGRIEMMVSRLRENDRAVTLRFLVMERSVAADDPQQAAPPARPAPGTAGREAGAGLGPAFIQRLVGLMGGRTGVEHTPGDGDRYWFDVDLEKQEALEATSVPSLSKAELATKRALIVDSSAVARRALRSRVEAVGCRVSEAADADEAHTVLRAAVESGDPFHFVLIDRDLPGVDGEELGARIRADHALDVARMVMLTNVGRRGDAPRARAKGFSAFLPKAVGVEELLEALCEVTRQAMLTPPGGTPELVTHYSLVEGRRGKTRILLVDEDAVSQVVTQWCLGRLGYKPEIAATLAEARAAWEKGAFDIVLADERMADGDAVTLARELRQHEGEGRHAAVIAMFRDENSPARADWEQSGLGDFVTKPVDLVVLTGLVERLTGTGLPSGSAAEEECAGSAVRHASPPAPGKLEFVMPDVDRILTEPEMRAAMAVAMRASTPAGGSVARPGSKRGPAAAPAVVAAPKSADPPPREAAESAEQAARGSAAKDLAGGSEEPPAPDLDMLKPVDVVPLQAAGQWVASGLERDAVAADEAPAEATDPPGAPAEDPEALAPAIEETQFVPPPSAVVAHEDALAAPDECEAVHLEVIESPGQPHPSEPESAPAFDLGRLESASMGLPSVRDAMLNAFLAELSPFLDKLSWALSDEDAQRAASEAHGLAVLSRSIGANACAEALEELESRGTEGMLRSSDPIMRRCYGLGLSAAREVRALLAGERRAA